MLQTHVLQHVWVNTTSQHTSVPVSFAPQSPSHRHLKAQPPPPHAPAVLIVVSADVAEVSSKGLHGQRAGDFPTPPLDDDTCGGDGGAQPSFRHLGTFPVFLAAQFLGVVWGVMGNCISISTTHRMLLQRGGGDAEGSKCKDICHQDSAASRGTGTMTHPRATLRSTGRTSLEGTGGKQRSLFFPRVGDLVKGCREGGLCILYCVGRIISQRSKEAQSPLTSQGPFLGPWDGKFPAFPTVTHPLTDTSTSECFLCTYKGNAASKVIAQVTTSRAWGPRENLRDLPIPSHQWLLYNVCPLACPALSA